MDLKLLTPLHWSTFWSTSIPSAIMLTLPRVWAMQVVSIVTPVVDYWRVAVASHPDLTIFGCNNLGTVDCGELIELWQQILIQTELKFGIILYLSLTDGILEPFQTRYHHAGISWSMHHPIHIHNYSCSKLLRSRSGQLRWLCHISGHQVYDS